MENKKEYKYFLAFSGMDDSPMQRAACAYVAKYVTLANNAHMQVVTREEAQMLIDAGELKPFGEYRKIDEGQIGAVADAWAERYTDTWHNVASVDHMTFVEGWVACIRNMQIEKVMADWDEAIRENNRHLNYKYAVTCADCGKEITKAYTAEGAEYYAQYHNDYSPYIITEWPPRPHKADYFKLSRHSGRNVFDVKGE